MKSDFVVISLGERVFFCKGLEEEYTGYTLELWMKSDWAVISLSERVFFGKGLEEEYTGYTLEQRIKLDNLDHLKHIEHLWEMIPKDIKLCLGLSIHASLARSIRFCRDMMDLELKKGKVSFSSFPGNLVPISQKLVHHGPTSMPRSSKFQIVYFFSYLFTF